MSETKILVSDDVKESGLEPLRAAGFTSALTVDIGGTSADVGLILDGEPLVEPGGRVAGVRGSALRSLRAPGTAFHVDRTAVAPATRSFTPTSSWPTRS